MNKKHMLQSIRGNGYWQIQGKIIYMLVIPYGP